MDTPSLSPVETALLTSLQDSQTAHEQRLDALEQLLKQLTKQSSEDSASAKNAFTELRQQLDQLSTKLTNLDARLTKWAPVLTELDKQLKASLSTSQTQANAYNQAVSAFNSMRAEYNALASGVTQLRRLAGQ